MEIVSIERRTFEAMVAKFDRFVSRMDAICQRHGEKTMGEWMDNQDVCRILNISPRTLQTLRDSSWPAVAPATFRRRDPPEVEEEKRPPKLFCPLGRLIRQPESHRG
mgnify:CR=1 FL=1